MVQGADASHYGGSAYHGLMAEAGAMKAVYPSSKGDTAAPSQSSASDSDELERLRAQVADLASKVDALSKA